MIGIDPPFAPSMGDDRPLPDQEGLSAGQALQLLLLATGDEDLSPLDMVQHEGLPLGVQLRQHIVQQKDGPLPRLLLKDLSLSEKHRLL